jgi:hypothetical protein
MTYDARRGWTVVLGGNVVTGSVVLWYGPVTEAAWESDGGSWQPGTSAPQPCTGEGLVFDTVRMRPFALGCTTPPTSYELDGAAWAPVSTAEVPPAVAGRGMVFDSARGKAVLFTGTETWEYTPSAAAAGRYATHLFVFPLQPAAAVGSASVTYVGAGAGDGGAGSAIDQVKLYVWSWADWSWHLLGTHAAADSAPAAARTIAAPLPAGAMTAERLWLLAVAPPSSAGASGVPSRLWTDFVRIDASYTLP